MPFFDYSKYTGDQDDEKNQKQATGYFDYDKYKISDAEIQRMTPNESSRRLAASKNEAALSVSQKPKTTRGGAPRPEGALGYVTDFLDATLGRIAFPQESDPAATKAISRAIDTGANIATAGASHALQSTPDRPYKPVSTGIEGLDTTADVIGTIGGYTGFGRGAIGSAGNRAQQLLQRLAPTTPRIAQNAARGAAEGGISSAAIELADMGQDINQRDETTEERLTNIALGTGVGGGIGAALEPAARGISNLLQRLRKPAEEVVPTPAPTPPLLLPAPKPQVLAEGPLQPIMGTVEEATLVPKGVQLVRPGASKVVNPAEEQLKALYRQAEEVGLPPGREYEALQDIWSSMAPKNAGNLDQLVDQAAKPVDLPDLLQRLKKRQTDAERYGINPLEGVARNFAPATREITRQVGEQPSFVMLGYPSQKVEELSSTLRKQKEPSIATSSGSEKMFPLKRAAEEAGEPLPQGVNPRDLLRQQLDMEPKKQPKRFSFERAYAAVVDDLHALDKATKQLGGKDLPVEKNPYTLARLSRGVAGKAETLLKGGIYNADGVKVGKSLQEILKPWEDRMDDLIDYSVAKRALDYDAKGLTAGIKPVGVGGNDREVAESVILQLDSPEIQQAHRELMQFNDHMLDMLVNSGMLGRESVERLKLENPNYLPFFRVQDEKTVGFAPLKNKFANLGDPIKKRTGSQRKIINPVESIIKNVYQMANIAERNKVGSALFDLAENAGENGWVRVVGKDKGISVDELSKALEKADAEMVEGKSQAVDEMFKAGKGDKVYVYKDGERVEMELQPDLYRAIMTLDAPKQHFFIKMLSYPTQTLRAGAVLSPDFGPVNVIRDQFSAFINSKYGYIPFVDMFKGLTSVLKRDDLYWQWKNSGGANAVMAGLDREYLQNDLRSMIKQSLVNRVKTAAKSPLQTVLAPLRKASEITEEATRLGEFKKGLKKGASPQEAAFASRDLMDFNRAGFLGRDYNKITAFFNAAVQSTDKMVRTFRSDPLGASLRAVLSVTLPSIALYAMNRDQEWYQNIPQRDKDLFWFYKPTGTEQIVKIPKPFEVGILFGTAAERMLDQINGKDPEAMKELGGSILGAFSPNWIPTAIQPWIEAYANKSFYNDAPIVPRREEDLLPEDQYGPYNSELSKLLGRLTETSPRKIEHIYRGYTGGLGKYALSGTDYLAEQLGVNKTELPDRGLQDTPIVGRFLVKNLEGNNQSIEDFYKLMDKLKKLKKSSDKNEVPFKDKRLYDFVNKVSRQISELQSKKRSILESNTLNGQQKTTEMKKLDELITKLSKQALKGGGEN